MSYTRVIPRDLFNEANFLKCLGQVALIAHDKEIPGLQIIVEDPQAGFPIGQIESSGAIYSDNFQISNKSGRRVSPFRPLNSRATFPLFLGLWDAEEIEILTDKGEFTPEFLEWCAN